MGKMNHTMVVRNALFIFGEKPLLVLTFSGDSHFSPYILFLSLLVPILKTLPILVPAITSEMENAHVANDRIKNIKNILFYFEINKVLVIIYLFK